MKRLFTLILILFCFAEVKGQIMWERTGLSTSQDVAFSQLIIKDSLVYLNEIGITNPNTAKVNIISYSITGRQKFTKPIYNGVGLPIYKWISTPGNYLIQVGSRSGYYPTFAEKIYTQKINAITGDTLTRKYINTTDFIRFGRNVGITNDAGGGFTIAGESIIRLAALGAAGKRKSSIIKVDSAGNLIWQKHYGPGTFLNTHGLTRNNRGNYILGGNIMHWLPNKGIWHPFIFEIKPNGDSLLRKTFFLRDSTFNETVGYSQDFVNTPDGGYVFYGTIDTSSSTVNDLLFYVAKVDSLFNPVWLYKNSGQFKDNWIRKLQRLPDGSFVLLTVRNSTSDFVFLRIDQNGNYISHQAFQSNICSQIYLNDFLILPDSSAILAGGGCGGNKAYLARIANVLAPTVINGASEEFNKTSEGELKAFPNPATETVTFTYDLPPKVQLAEIKIHEIATGKLVIQLPLKTFEKQVQISLANLRSGMYAYTLLADGVPVSTKKLVVVK